MSDTTVPIGEFSRLTHLSIKALRHYHAIGLLEPVQVDDGSSYRRYDVDQVSTALVIRRLRELEMPLTDVHAVVAASNEQHRDALISEHLLRMEGELDRTRDVVASLRGLLGAPEAAMVVERRMIPDQLVVAISSAVAMEEIMTWAGEAFGRLTEFVADHDLLTAGPAGATYTESFFHDDRGEVRAFVPVTATPQPLADEGVETAWLPGVLAVVTVHSGAYSELDRTYGALGSHIARHETALPEPIREVYLIGPAHTHNPDDFRTEVCWPIVAPERKR